MLLGYNHPFWTFIFNIIFYGFQTGSVPPATNSRLSPLPPEPADFYNPTAPVDIPLDSAAVRANSLLLLLLCSPGVIFYFSWHMLIKWPDHINFKYRIWKRKRESCKLRKLNWKGGNRYLIYENPKLLKMNFQLLDLLNLSYFF